MAYLANDFIFEINDCDASLLIAFHQHCERLCNNRRDQIMYRAQCKFSGGPKWDNLMIWCYYIVTKAIPAPHKKENDSKLSSVMFGALGIAFHTEGSWEECKLQLDEFRVVAGKLNKRWLL